MEKELDEKKELKEEVLIECPDGQKRTRQEYADWIYDLVLYYN